MAGKRRHRQAEAGRQIDKSRSGTWVEVEGRVVRLLPDDFDEARHQRLILDLRSISQTLLVAHNLDVAERIPLSLGDRLRARGIYEWNDLGGLLHWTHRDPMGVEDGGYIEYRGRRFS